MELGNKAIKQLSNVKKRIGNVWPSKASEVLEKRNPDLLAELCKLESIMCSLLSLSAWPAPIRKQWDGIIAEYEKTALQCVTYAKRHLPFEEI